jgi:hypothetical protein
MPQLVEVVAYLGGALVLAAGALFVVREWASLGFGTRVAFLAVVALVLAVAGTVVARTQGAPASLREPRHDLRRRLAGTLLVGAAIGASFLVGQVLDHLGDYPYPDVYWPVVAGGAAAVLGSAVGYRFAPTALGLLGMLVGTMVVVMNLMDRLGQDQGVWGGVVLFAVAVVWLGLTERDVFREQTVARSLGVALALLGGQMPVMDGGDLDWIGYLLTAVVAGAGIWLYLVRLAWPYLAAAVVAVTLVVPEAVTDWTQGSLGVVGAVLVAGITLLLASFAGYRIRERRTHAAAGD